MFLFCLDDRADNSFILVSVVAAGPRCSGWDLLLKSTHPSIINQIAQHAHRIPACCVSSVPVCSKPVISPSGPHVVVPKRGKLELSCHDDATLSGAPGRVRWQRERARRLEGEVEEDGVAYIKVSAAQAYHMGRYVCVNNSTLEHSSIYVYVKGGCLNRGKRPVFVCVCTCMSSLSNESLSSPFRPPECLPAHHGEWHPGPGR